MTANSNMWIERIQSLIAQSQDVPMWGSIPSFPWDTFSEEIKKALAIENLCIAVGKSDWKTEDVLLEGMGENPLKISGELSPIKGNFFFIFPQEDFAKIASWSIYPKANTWEFSDPDLQEGFLRYLALETMRIIDHLSIFPKLTPKLTHNILPEEKAYCIDISFERNKETAWGRLLCPASFQQVFKKHFSSSYRFSIPSHLYKDISLDLHLQAGKTTIKQEIWEQVKIGDFIRLDQCSYSPKGKKGTLQLTLQNTPLFQVKLKEDQIKILDYALYYEENKMPDEVDDGNFEDSSESDHSPPPSGEEENNHDNHSIEEKNIVESSTEEQSVNPDIDTSEETPAPIEEPSEKLIAPNQIPLNLSVEVAKLQMNLDKLLTLKPGNVLNLSTRPELGVSLTANGRPIAHGNLIQIGDVIGVKITQVGS